MKKIIITICLFTNIGHAQTPYYDALQLNTLIDPVTHKFKTDSISELKIGSILYKYALNKKLPADSMDYASVKTMYTTSGTTNFNPFLKQFFPTVGSGQSKALADMVTNFAGSVGGLDVTTIADGFAKFIVKRTKQELNISFFTRFRSVLEDSNFRDLRTVFPNTYNLLEDVGTEIYNYQRYIQNLKEAFNDDMKSMPKNLPGIIDNHPEIFNEYPDVVAAIRSAFYITNSLVDQVHPGDILAEYPLEYLDSLKNKNFKGALQTLQLFSASLRDTATSDTASYWITTKQLRKLSGDIVAFKIYLGLIYQQAINKDIQYENSSLKAMLDKVAAAYDKGYNIYESYRSYVVTFSEKASALEKMIKEYDKAGSDSLKAELYAKYFSASVDLIEYSTKAGELPLIKETVIADLHKTLEPYFDISYSAADLVTDIARKNYSSAINNAVHIYGVAKNIPERHICKLNYRLMYANANSIADASQKAGAINNVDNATANDVNLTPVDRIELRASRNMPVPEAELTSMNNLVVHKTAIKTQLDKLNVVLNKLSMYGGFISSVATAKTSDEVESAIEAFALPSGSARIKRESPFNVSLNAYCGLFSGYELIQGYNDMSEFQFNTHGITAPVGIAISKGKSKFLGLPLNKNEKHWSYTAFVSVIDLGAVTAFRFNDPNVSQIPKIELKDILSPGLFLSIGIPKCPLSVNTGAQIGPNLRTVSQTTNSYSDALYWRFSFSLVVDIPILNFYTKSAD